MPVQQTTSIIYLQVVVLQHYSRRETDRATFQLIADLEMGKHFFENILSSNEKCLNLSSARSSRVCLSFLIKSQFTIIPRLLLLLYTRTQWHLFIFVVILCPSFLVVKCS